MREEKKFFFFCNKKKLLARLILYHHFYQFTRNFDLISNVPPIKLSLNWWLIFEYDLITTDLAKKTESCGVSYSFSLENPLISLLQLLILLYNSSYMTPLDIFIENIYPTINYYYPFANFNFEVDISLSCMKISQFFFSSPTYQKSCRLLLYGIQEKRSAKNYRARYAETKFIIYHLFRKNNEMDYRTSTTIEAPQ